MKLKIDDIVDDFIVAKHVVKKRGDVFQGWCIKPKSIDSKCVLSMSLDFVEICWFDTKEQAVSFLKNIGKTARDSLYEKYRSLA